MIFLNRIILSIVTLSGASLIATTAYSEDLTPQQIRQRLTVTAEVFVFDGSGKKLLAKMSENSVVKASIGNTSGPLIDRWASRSGLFDGVLAMKTSWDIDKDGVIKVKLTEYASDSEQKRNDENRYARELKTEERIVDLMGSINWVSVNNHNGKKVVVRYTPNLSEDIARDVTDVKIAGQDTTIVDNTGALWADHLSIDGKYVGITTHRGTLLLSYYPFNGSKEFGVAIGNRTEVTLGKNVVVSLISKSNFLPGSSSGKVYGMYLADRKSESLTSNDLNTSNQEEEFLKRYR